MGYTTDFSGSFTVKPAFKPEHRAYLAKFAETRRMARDAKVTESRPDPIRQAVGLPVGREGGYFVGEGGMAGQGEDMFGDERPTGVTNYNSPPRGQPGLWCQWVPGEDAEDHSTIEWDGGEKFYSYVEWLEYLIEHFLSKWGYTVDGTVEWLGEDPDDRGKIIVKKNKVTTKKARVVYDEEE